MRVGRVPGIYRTWGECSANTNEVPGMLFQRFSNYGEAIDFMTSGCGPRRVTAAAARCSPYGFADPGGYYLTIPVVNGDEVPLTAAQLPGRRDVPRILGAEGQTAAQCVSALVSERSAAASASTVVVQLRVRTLPTFSFC